MENRVFLQMCDRIKFKEFKNSSEARREISKCLVRGQNSAEEHSELRQLLINEYED